MELLYVFLPFILALGLITSYTDIKYKKIKNTHLTYFIFFGIIIYIISIIYFLIKKEINSNYLLELMANLSFSLLIGFFLWKKKIWAGGDAKLFFTYALLIPLSAYKLGYIRYFPSFTLLVNIFVPLSLFYLSYAVFNCKKKHIKKVIEETFKKENLIRGVLTLFTFFWILSLIGIKDIFLRYLFIIIIGIILEKTFKKPNMILIPMTITRLIFDIKVYSLDFFGSFIFYFLVYTILRSLISSLSDEIFEEKVSLKNLKPGMIVENPIKINKKNIIKPYSSGLTASEISKLRKLRKNRAITINKTMNFAIFIFIGVLITLLVKGNVIVFLVNFIKPIG